MLIRFREMGQRASSNIEAVGNISILIIPSLIVMLYFVFVDVKVADVFKIVDYVVYWLLF